jgi:hypothetical protein
MEKQYELREVILGELLAATLEREASQLPPTHRAHALILCRQADYFRHHFMRSLWVWREAALAPPPDEDSAINS